MSAQPNPPTPTASQVQAATTTAVPEMTTHSAPYSHSIAEAGVATATPASELPSQQDDPSFSERNDWELILERLLSVHGEEAWDAAKEVRRKLDLVHATEFPLFLSAFLPAFSSILSTRTHPHPDTASIEHKLRHEVLDVILRMPTNDVLRPHAPHLVALALNILRRDYEENALLASKIIFNLFKVYRNLPQDNVQPFLDFVIVSYRNLSTAVSRNFTFPQFQPTVAASAAATADNATPSSTALSIPSTTVDPTSTEAATVIPMDIDSPEINLQIEQQKPLIVTTATGGSTTESLSRTVSNPTNESPSSSASIVTTTTTSILALRSNQSLRVLTESPLIVMLLLQLYPSFLKTNIPVLISVMMEALTILAPKWSTVMAANPSVSNDSSMKRLYLSRSQQLVASQAKTMSFVTYLLRSFANELKPFEDRLASSVVALMQICPRESFSTRKELLVATRHILNSDFRRGFFRHVDKRGCFPHVDSFLDERVLLGTSMPHRFSDQALLRPLAYTTLSDLVQHARSILPLKQLSKVILVFSRIIHDSSHSLPMSTQYTAVRTLLSTVDLVLHNEDPQPQFGRDLLVRMLRTLTEKFEALVDNYPSIMRQEAHHGSRGTDISDDSKEKDEKVGSSTSGMISGLPHPVLESPHLITSNRVGTLPDSVRDLQIMVRAIIVGSKTLINAIITYRSQREKLQMKVAAASNKDGVVSKPPPIGPNDEIFSAMSRLTSTEAELIDRYILTVFTAAKSLKDKGVTASLSTPSTCMTIHDRTLSEQHRDALTYFAAAFTAMDGITLARTLGRRMHLLVNAIIEDPVVMVVPRHLLGVNATISFEFCSLLLDHIVCRMNELAYGRPQTIVFLDPPGAQVPSSYSHDYPNASPTITAIVDDLYQRSVKNEEDDENQRNRSAVLLQLFERILKSLSSFAENESIVRRHLRRIVAVCLTSTMENAGSMPDNYCMLLRYIFRSISAGKFEESYKELLPLIPTVLNGLYRIICCTKDLSIRYTAVELCLTIPARLSSLLPHINLLLRIIIPALDSSSGDLVNLGLRTLEFWVDNLNPLFLIPEISKQSEIFASLMQSLSRHLRPAPYPYGLLTLRLLGKLGGKNRHFLREPFVLFDSNREIRSDLMFLSRWDSGKVGSSVDSKRPIHIPLPLDRCIELLKLIATTRNIVGSTKVSDKRKSDEGLFAVAWDEKSRLWIVDIDRFDVAEYQRNVIIQTKQNQATACLSVIQAAVHILTQNTDDGSIPESQLRDIYLGLMYTSMIESTKTEAKTSLQTLAARFRGSALIESITIFLHEPSPVALDVGIDVLCHLFNAPENDTAECKGFWSELLVSLCEAHSSCHWGERISIHEVSLYVITSLGPERSRENEILLISAAFLSVKSIPLELSGAISSALRYLFRVCVGLYGTPWLKEGSSRTIVLDALETGFDLQMASQIASVTKSPGASDVCRPCDDVVRIVLTEIAAPQDSARFAARFLLKNFILVASPVDTIASLVSDQNQMTLVRKVLFQRGLRLSPLSQQVGVVEGLAVIVRELPRVLSLTDQHLLAFVSELLKLSSVADGEMSDQALRGLVVDKNGYTSSTDSILTKVYQSSPSHSFSLFHRRMCVVEVEGVSIIVPEQTPIGVQLRVATIVLLHSLICADPSTFFDSDQATPVGNIRPHVVSLLFRSLVSTPLKAVSSAHIALKDTLDLSSVSNDENAANRTNSRLPKELLQACIRPVLLNLREHTRLSIPLLRGLQRLLSLLSSWFNKTLGEKLLDHLQNFLDPGKIIARKIWTEGDEPYVAAAIVDVFHLLPNASQFVDPIVKTCMKLEVCLPTYNVRHPDSPFRRPLARYLDQYPQYAVAFFFQRLKTPVYSELFQSLIKSNECISLRSYLCTKQCSVMILNYCFERPLAIIRAEKNSGSAVVAPHTFHGVNCLADSPSQVSGDTNNGSPNPMTEESLELQLQGFRIVETLLSSNPGYFDDHNDVMRAFRWLWRSKGRFLRLQNEDSVPARFHAESRQLAFFLMNYGESLPNDDFDILFELIRIFLQPSSSDFSFVSNFLRNIVSRVLTIQQQELVMSRFFSLLIGESSEETKILSMQYLIYPLLSSQIRKHGNGISLTDENRFEAVLSNAHLITSSLVERFVTQVLAPVEKGIVYGDRFKVELLRLCNLMICNVPSSVESKGGDLIEYCQPLLKSEDTSCKGWAYLVTCRCIAAVDISDKITIHVYREIVREYQLEGRELFLEALDVLVPVLSSKLNEEQLRILVDQTANHISDTSTSTLLPVYIIQVVVRNSDVFRPYRNLFSRHLLSSLNRLALPLSSPLENRVLAIKTVELLANWNDYEMTHNEKALFSQSQIDMVANFLVRLRLILAEPVDNRNSRLEAGSHSLNRRVISVIRRVFSTKVEINEQPFEKVVSNNRESVGLLLSSLEILVEITKLGCTDYTARNPILFNELLSLCFRYARGEHKLREELRAFAIEMCKIDAISSTLLVPLERAIMDADADLRQSGYHKHTDSPSRQGRAREKLSTAEATADWAVYALDLLVDICSMRTQVLTSVASTLLTFASTLSKNHIMDANSKHRQGPSLLPRVASLGIKCHTPTTGIINESCSYDPVETARPSHLRQRWPRDEPEISPQLRCLVRILRVFESSDIIFRFTQNRKLFLHIVGSLVDSSDSIYILLGAVRVMCKLLCGDNESPSPLTLKERSGFLTKLAGFDSSNLMDDVSMQPLADLMALFTERFNLSKESSAVNKLLAACLLNADAVKREALTFRFFQHVHSCDGGATDLLNLFLKMMQVDFECLGGRFWIVILLEIFLTSLEGAHQQCLRSMRQLANGDVVTCMRLFDALLPAFWESLFHDESRLQVISLTEALLAKPYLFQLSKGDATATWPRHVSCSARTLLNSLTLLNPMPLIDSSLLVYLAENYNAWHEVVSILSRQLVAFTTTKTRMQGKEITLAALRHCYGQLSEQDICLSLAQNSCAAPLTANALKLDVYNKIEEAAQAYMDLMTSFEISSNSEADDVSEFEMNLWEDRWVHLQKDLCQQEVVNSFAESSSIPYLKLECAWKSQDWINVRSILSSWDVLASSERGDPIMKISETVLAVAEGKLNEVENLHAQTAQLCLFRWQLLPRLSNGSPSHASLLHFFHRLVEIRESAQLMVEVSSHSNGRTLPDLKNILNAWRHRLPNDWESLSMWDEIFAWRGIMFNTITSTFQSVCQPDKLSILHDRPWTVIRMAKTARKQCLRDTSVLLLNKTANEMTMNVSDAFFKLREQILSYYNLDSDSERHAGLNLINTTNLSFFDHAQKGELFRMKAMFLASLGGRSKANQAYCHSLQIYNKQCRTWESWGSLCSSLGAVAEKQLEHGPEAKDVGPKDIAKDPKAIAKKVAQYLAQAMGCYLEAVRLDTNEWNRIHLSKCLWMLLKDGSTHGVLCQTLENRGSLLPGWVWLPFLPQLLTSLCRPEGRAVKTILSGLVKTYPQAIYYSLRVFYLERRDVERSKESPPTGNQMKSLVYVDELISLLRRSHASLWSSLEAVLEELLVKFRPLHEEELLSPVVALLERAESQLGTTLKRDEEEAVTMSIWKTIWKITAKFFRPPDQVPYKNDERTKKTALFKETYRDDFESDFRVSSSAAMNSPGPEGKVPLTLAEFVSRLRIWKRRLEENVSPRTVSLIENSPSLAVFGLADSPDLWSGSCDPKYLSQHRDNDQSIENDSSVSSLSSSLSAEAAMNAALSASRAVANAASREGIGGDYGGGSSLIEIPGQYAPNTSQWADARPSPELHPKLLRFEQSVHILRRNDQLVRRIGMIGSDGRTYRFIVQAAVPFMTRTDERTAQVTRVLDILLRRNMNSARAFLSVQPHQVLPMAQRLRLVSEPEGRLSLEEVCREACERRGYDPSERASRFNDDIAKAIGSLDLNVLSKEEMQQQERDIRLPVFLRVKESIGEDSSALFRHIHQVMETPELLFQFRRMFAQQWATNCLLQYGFCVAERTPGRVVLVKSTGCVLSPEFRISYNSQGFMEPPMIPFRLTQNILIMIGFPLLEGRFIPSMANVAGSIREYKSDLTSVLRLLARDDLIAFYTRSMPKSDSKTHEMEKQLSDRVIKNASLVLSRINECAPVPSSVSTRHVDERDAVEHPIDKKILDLIETARSSEMLCQMPSSYQGWL